MRTCYILMGLVTFFLGAQAQSFDKQKLDDLFDLIERQDQGMGSLSIFRGGQEVYQRSIGYSDLDKEIAADAYTIYRIGSISKTFTAAIILQLIDENRLALDTKLGKYFADLPNASKITIEQLLRHRSGLYNFTKSPAYLEWMENPKSRSELLEIFQQNGTVFEPGVKFEYSNTNYVLLSFIVEDVEQQSLSEVLKERITKKLQLNHTYYGGGIGDKPNEALSYTMKEDWQIATETDMSIPLGAGAIVSTPTDLNRFFHALFSGQVISKMSLQHMSKLMDNYGMGLFQIPFYERRALGHNGGIDGFQSSAAYFVDEEIGIAYLSNGLVMGINDILIGVLSIYFGKDYELPTFAQGIEVEVEDLDQYLGVYSSDAVPLKITISLQGKQLMAQATGQGAFPLEAYDANKFRFAQAGIKMEFIPEDNKLILNQGGGSFEFRLDE